MRWSYLIPRLVLVAGVWTFFALAFDPLMRWSLVRMGQAVTRARVDIADVDTTFFPPSIELRDVAVAHRRRPGKNVLEFDSFRVRLAGGPLLRRSFVVDEGTLEGLRWDADRSDSGQIEQRIDGIFSKHLAALRDQAKELGRDWLDAAGERAADEFDPRQLETVRLAEALEQQWTGRFESLKARIAALDGRARRIQDTVKSAERDVLARIEAYRQAAVEARDLLAEADAIKRELDALAPAARNDYQRLGDARRQDLELARRKVDALRRFDSEAISNALLGRELAGRLQTVVEWAEWMRDHVPSISAGVQPERSRGVDVEFVKHEPLPGVLIRNLLLSGELELDGERVPYTGSLAGLNSNPRLYGRPAVLTITAQGRAQLALTASADYTADSPAFAITAVYEHPLENGLDLGDDADMAVRLDADRIRWTVNLAFHGEQIVGTLGLAPHNVRLSLHAPETSAALAGTLRAALEEVREIEATVEIAGTVRQPRWTVRSNLGTQLAAGLNASITRLVEDQQRRLLARVESETESRLASYAQRLNGRFQEAGGQLKLSETGVRSLFQRVSSRPLDLNDILQR